MVPYEPRINGGHLGVGQGQVKGCNVLALPQIPPRVPCYGRHPLGLVRVLDLGNIFEVVHVEVLPRNPEWDVRFMKAHCQEERTIRLRLVANVLQGGIPNLQVWQSLLGLILHVHGA